MPLIHAFTAHAFRRAPRFGGRAVRASCFPGAYHAAEAMVEGCRMVTICRSPRCAQHVYVLHGGGYVLEAAFPHRRLLRTLADMGLRVSFLDYPLAPEHTALDTHRAAVSGYLALQGAYPEDMIHVLGDSAGGGLALALLLLLREQGVSPRPEKTVLVSPWLDVGMKNPAIQGQRGQDKLLPYDALLDAGRLYAGAMGVESPYVSPLYGDLRGLGELLLFYSGRELFAPDCRQFIRLVRAAEGTDIRHHEVPGLFHDYLLLPFLRESRRAYTRIAEFFGAQAIPSRRG